MNHHFYFLKKNVAKCRMKDESELVFEFYYRRVLSTIMEAFEELIKS